MERRPRAARSGRSDAIQPAARQVEKRLRDRVARLLPESGPEREARWRLMHFLIHRDRRPEALEILTGLLSTAVEPEQRAFLVLSTGQLLEQLGDYENARAAYERGVGLEPMDPRTWYLLHNNLGFCLNQLGRHEEAARWCRTAIRIEPERHNAHKNLGLACEGLGRFGDAARSYIRAVWLAPNDPRAFRHLEDLVAGHPELGGEIPDLEEQLRQCRVAVQLAQRHPRL